MIIIKMIVDNAGHDINYCKDHDEYDNFDDHDKNNLSPKNFLKKFCVQYIFMNVLYK